MDPTVRHAEHVGNIDLGPVPLQCHHRRRRLAYVVVVERRRTVFARSKPLIKSIRVQVGHIDLGVLSITGSGFAFIVISMAHRFFDGTPGLESDEHDRTSSASQSRNGARSSTCPSAWPFKIDSGLGFTVLVALTTIH